MGVESFDGIWSAWGIESYEIVFLGGNFLFTCSDSFAVERHWTCRLATMHSVRQTQRWQYHGNSGSYRVAVL